MDETLSAAVTLPRRTASWKPARTSASWLLLTWFCHAKIGPTRCNTSDSEQRLKVSRICLGAMTYGSSEMASRGCSTKHASRPFIKRALELGINFFDTADMYSRRRQRGSARPRARRNSRRAIRSSSRPRPSGRSGRRPQRSRACRASISSMRSTARSGASGVDYVDLYQIHRFDPDTPIEETLDAAARHREGREGALHRRVEHVGVAVREDALRGGSPRLDAFRLDAEPLQPRLPRGRARDDAALFRGGYRRDSVEPAGERLSRRQSPKRRFRSHRARKDRSVCARAHATSDTDFVVADRVVELAKRHGVKPTQVASAWLLSKATVSSPIVGASEVVSYRRRGARH